MRSLHRHAIDSIYYQEYIIVEIEAPLIIIYSLDTKYSLSNSKCYVGSVRSSDQ